MLLFFILLLFSLQSIFTETKRVVKEIRNLQKEENKVLKTQ